MRSAAMIAGAMLLSVSAGAAMATTYIGKVVPFRDKNGKLSPLINTASQPSNKRFIYTHVRPLSAGGFNVEDIFSQGDPVNGAHLCAGVNVLDRDQAIIAMVRHRVGLSATAGLGHADETSLVDDLRLTPDEMKKAVYIQVAQWECPEPTDWAKAFKYVEDVVKIIRGN